MCRKEGLGLGGGWLEWKGEGRGEEECWEETDSFGGR